MAFAAISRVPLVVTLPGGDLAALPDIGYGAQLKLRSRIATRMVLSHASAILAPSEWLTRQAASLAWKTIHCPFGVALDRWPPAEPQQRSSGVPLRLIHVGTLNRVKDPFGLLEAVRLLACQGVDFTLEMVGEDTLGGAVERHCRSLGLGERVTFRGFIPNDELRQHVEGTDLLVMSSRHEGAPIVLLEAAAAGIPTVGSEVGCIADWAPDASVAVPVGDSAALANAIARLADDEEERMRLARAAHARALAYSADDYAARVRSIYAEVAAR
jgi:glycosyltransferase involved in cell wall biosynthesis